MTTSLAHRGVVHLGLDVSKDWIAVGVLRPDEQVPDVEKVFADEESVRRLIARVGPPAKLRACSEAGPTGYELHRLLTSLGVRCDVIAPSTIRRCVRRSASIWPRSPLAKHRWTRWTPS